MGKYRVAKDDFVEVPLYMDVSGRKVKCYTRSEAEELQANKIKSKQINLKTLASISEKTDDQVKEVATLEGEIAEMNKSPIDPSLVEEKTYWKRPDGFEEEFITEQSWDRNEVTGAVKYNSGKNRRAMLGCLLKKWTLDKDDPALRLEFTAMTGSQTKMMLLPQVMTAIWELDKDILSTLLNEASRKISGDDLASK